MRNVMLLALSSILSCLSLGCFDTDAAVFVDASIGSPNTSVTMGGALGDQMSGSFALLLHLGPRASGPSTVTLQSFDMTNADQTSSIMPLPNVVATPAPPVEVGLDSDVTVNITFGTDNDLLDPALRDPVCDPGGIRISGAIKDSLQDGATPVVSDVFTASCM